MRSFYGKCDKCLSFGGPNRTRCEGCGRKRPYFPRSTGPAKRFWHRVEKGPGCWIWRGARRRGQYGNVAFKKRFWRAHRLSWYLTHGKIPKNKRVCHTCDNRWCVNPAHLFIATQKDNIWDMVRKGRKVGAKLTPTQVRLIYVQLKTASNSANLLAKKYGVSLPTVYRIGNGATWSAVTQDLK